MWKTSTVTFYILHWPWPRTQMLYKCTTREAWKGVVVVAVAFFFSPETEGDLRELRLGVKICLFSWKRILFCNSIREGLWVIFQTPLFHKTCSPKYLVSCKTGCEKGKILVKGCFLQKDKSLYSRSSPRVSKSYNLCMRVEETVGRDCA